MRYVLALVMISFIQATSQELQFEKFFPGKSTNVVDRYYNNYIGVLFSIGEPRQEVVANINMTSYPTWFLSEKAEMENKKYNSTLSTTKLDPEWISIYYVFRDDLLVKAYLSVDSIRTNNNFHVPDFRFYSAIVVNYPNVNSGLLGLGLVNEYNFNQGFIKALKGGRYISASVFYFWYNNERNGTLNIGEYPHEDRGDLFSKNDYIAYKSTVYNKQNIWGLTFASVEVGGDVSEKNILGHFKIELGFIFGSNHYHYIIFNGFFKEKIKEKQCEIIHLESLGLSAYQCVKDFNKTQFKEILFNVDNIHKVFKFDSDDLFTYDKEVDKEIFLIAFNATIPAEETKNEGNYWVFGEPFFRKYTLVFDQERKIIGTYSKRLNAVKGVSSSSKWIWILIFAIVLMAFCFVWLHFKNRKKRIAKEWISNGIGNLNTIRYVIKDEL